MEEEAEEDDDEEEDTKIQYTLQAQYNHTKYRIHLEHNATLESLRLHLSNEATNIQATQMQH